MNYTDKETPWTRIIEHKWFEFGKDENGRDLEKTVISKEYSSEWKTGDEPYYPVNDEKNNLLYEQYNVFFPEHDSRYVDQQWKDHVVQGYPANLPDQPVYQ